MTFPLNSPGKANSDSNYYAELRKELLSTIKNQLIREAKLFGGKVNSREGRTTGQEVFEGISKAQFDKITVIVKSNFLLTEQKFLTFYVPNRSFNTYHTPVTMMLHL